MNRDILLLVRRYVVSIGIDFGLVIIAFLFAFLLRFEGAIPQEYMQAFWRLILPICAGYALINYLFHLYNRIWKYSSSQEAISILGSVGITTGVLGLIDLGLPGQRPFPLSVVLIGGMLTLAGFVAVRYERRLVTGLLWRWRRMASGNRSKILIIGGGEAGQLLAWSLKNQREGYEVVGFIDDDPSKRGMHIHGIPVLGGREQIIPVASRRMVDTIAIAMDQVSAEDFHDILSKCQLTSAKVKVVPNFFEVVDGINGQPLMRDITVEDLLGRQAVPIDMEACRKLLAGKVTLVTGAAGSIGSELCRQILRFQPRLLLMLDNNETGIFELTAELSSKAKNPPIKGGVGNILQKNKMESLFQQYRPEIVFHCAAYKHVPLMEETPEEAIWVNLQGARLIANLALKYGVGRFVFISSDKAVEPNGVMGATKRLGELLMSSIPTNGKTMFTSVRFGNVLNSRGSIVPILLKQIEHGGPVTITHPEMKRFFMGLLESVSLIIQAATLTQGGDIFVLEMGEEIRIEDLAKRVIRLQGLRVGEDIQLVYSGVRPGEKLREKLTDPSVEEKEPTPHPLIVRVHSKHTASAEKINTGIDELIALAENGDREAMKARLFSLVANPSEVPQSR